MEKVRDIGRQKERGTKKNDSHGKMFKTEYEIGHNIRLKDTKKKR
jgi:hypothetical protein